MIDPTKGNIYSIDVDIKMGARERQVLSAFLQQEGFDILQTLMEDVVRSMNRQLVNVDPANNEEVIARHRVAYAAGRFYVDLMTRVKEEFNIQQYNAAAQGTLANPENPNSDELGLR